MHINITRDRQQHHRQTETNTEHNKTQRTHTYINLKKTMPNEIHGNNDDTNGRSGRNLLMMNTTMQLWGKIVHQNGSPFLVTKVVGFDIYLVSMEHLKSALENIYLERSNDEEGWGFCGEGREGLLKRNMMDLLDGEKNIVRNIVCHFFK